MDLSDFRPKSAFSMIWSGKCENVRKYALFRSKTHFCVFFAPKRKRTAWARNLAVANAFLVILGAVFAKKRKRADFAVLGDFSTSGRRNLLLRPKSGKSQKCMKIEKSRFSPEAPNPLKHKHLGTFLEPETHKCAFSTFGLTFPSWSVFGANSAPEVENKQNFTFFVPRVGKSRFCDSGRKKLPRTLRLSRVLRLSPKEQKSYFPHSRRFFNFMLRTEKLSCCFLLHRKKFFDEKTLFAKRLVFP